VPPVRSAAKKAQALANYLAHAQQAVTFPNPISFQTQYPCGDQYNGCQLAQARAPAPRACIDRCTATAR